MSWFEHGLSRIYYEEYGNGDPVLLLPGFAGSISVRKVVKTKASFPTPEAARKLLYLVNQNITKKWTMPMQN